MSYTPPTGAALLSTLRRDLRDTNATVSEQVFVDAQIEDFVNLGLAELNIERPIEDEITVSAGPDITLATSAETDDIIDTSADHGYVAGDRVRFTALTGGSGLEIDTEYIVSATSLSATTFRLSLTADGDLLDFTTDITAGNVRGATSGLDNLDLPYIWALELHNVVTRNRNYIDKADSDVRWLNGWRIYNGNVDLPKGIEDLINAGLADATLIVHVFGYRDRVRWAAANVPDLEDLSDEAALRLFVRAQGFKALTEDRALFGQWQTQANNTDVSATQLLGMVESASRDWERTIQRIRRVMRTEI